MIDQVEIEIIKKFISHMERRNRPEGLAQITLKQFCDWLTNQLTHRNTDRYLTSTSIILIDLCSFIHQSNDLSNEHCRRMSGNLLRFSWELKDDIDRLLTAVDEKEVDNRRRSTRKKQNDLKEAIIQFGHMFRWNSLHMWISQYVNTKTEERGMTGSEPIAIADVTKNETEELNMTGSESIAIAAVTKAVDFLFDEAKAILQDIRDRRKSDPVAKPLPVLPADTEPTTKETVRTWSMKNLRLRDDPDEVAFLLKQIEIFRFNRRHTLNTLNMMGLLTPQHIMHELRTAEDGIREYSQKLKNFIETVYGHKIYIVGLSSQ